MFENSGTIASLNQVKRCLNERLKTKYNIENEDITDEILKIHGLHKDNFNFIENYETLISGHLNDNSIDDNSNKNEKTIAGIHKEVTSSVDKIVGYRYLYRQMVEDYGKEEAKRLAGEMYDFSLALADSTQIMKVYCYAFDASKIVLEGRPFGHLPSVPPNRLSSYFTALDETIHQFSNILAGAIGVTTIFNDSAKLLMEKEKYSLDDIKNNKNNVRKYIENCFQNFVHSINHLSRNSVESPFVNVSIFDRKKLYTLISEMEWYYENKDIDYVVNYVMELQDIFLEFFDKGSPSQNGMLYRFPIVTINISKKENGNIKIEDNKFISNIAKKDIFRYNIFVSEGTKTSTCCRLYSDSEMLELAGQSNSFGGTSVSIGSLRVLTLNLNRIALECNNYDDFFNILDGRIESCLKILKSHKNLIKDTVNKGLQYFIKIGWINFNRLFTTVGIIGIIECIQTLESKCNNLKAGIDYTEIVLKYINNKVQEYATKYNTITNIEQIPGESMASRLVNVDKLIFGDQKVSYNLYSNQFISLWDETSIWDRMDKDGKYNQLLTGGGICHFNLADKVTPTQAKNLIEYAVKSGCEHFALNAQYVECENHHFNFGVNGSCPECGGKIIERFVRVVGFFTPLSSWNKARREYDFPNRKFMNV